MQRLRDLLFTRVFAAVCLVSLAVFALFTAACCVLPLTEWAHPRRERILSQPCDFEMRYNEMRCLRDGINPFDVWRGNIVRKPYRPMGAASHDGLTEPVNGYTPWAYVMALPISFLSRPAAWGTYVAVMLACLCVLSWGGYGVGCKVCNDRGKALLFATLPILAVAYPIWSNFNIGNYAVPILASVFMMCWCLDRGHDIWAGVFWSLAMIKPQNAILLAVPLLLRRRFLTCFVAAGICLACTLVASSMCHASVLTLILQIPAVGSGAFHGCATLPSYLRDQMDVTTALVFAAALGLAICIWLTVRMRRAESWVLFVLPAVMCSISWTYITSYSFSMAWFLVVAIMAVWVTAGWSRALVAFTVLACLLLPRFFTCWHGAASAFGRTTVSESVFYAVDTSVSLLVLILTVVFCLWTARHGDAPSPGTVNGRNGIKPNEFTKGRAG